MAGNPEFIRAQIATVHWIWTDRSTDSSPALRVYPCRDLWWAVI